MHNITPKDILVELLACKHNSQELLLNLCVPGLGLGKGSGCETHWLLKLKQSGSQPSLRGVTLERNLILQVIITQNQGLGDGSLDITPCFLLGFRPNLFSVFTGQLTKRVGHIRKAGQEFSQVLNSSIETQ